MAWCDVVIDAVFFPGAMNGDELELLAQKGMKWMGYEKSLGRFVVMECS